jgi:hypothetical protein
MVFWLMLKPGRATADEQQGSRERAFGEGQKVAVVEHDWSNPQVTCAVSIQVDLKNSKANNTALLH